MAFVAQAEVPPLREEADGALRVGASRVLLELVIHSFKNGATPEAIVQRYPTLALADVYAVIGYFLHHPGPVEEYLVRRERKSVEIRALIESSQPDLSELRARLLARRQAE